VVRQPQAAQRYPLRRLRFFVATSAAFSCTRQWYRRPAEHCFEPESPLLLVPAYATRSLSAVCEKLM
jgi:hypothetical protein